VPYMACVHEFHHRINHDRSAKTMHVPAYTQRSSTTCLKAAQCPRRLTLMRCCTLSSGGCLWRRSREARCDPSKLGRCLCRGTPRCGQTAHTWTWTDNDMRSAPRLVPDPQRDGNACACMQMQSA
jgi:hypothetical protein